MANIGDCETLVAVIKTGRRYVCDLYVLVHISTKGQQKQI